MAIHQSTHLIAESQGAEILGSNSFVANSSHILVGATRHLHPDIFVHIHGDDLANIVKQRSDDQFIVRALKNKSQYSVNWQ